LFNGKFGNYGKVVFPFEFFVHILSPILVVLALGFFLRILVTSPIEGLYSIAIPLLTVLPAMGFVYLMTRKYDTGKMMHLGGPSDLAAGAASFAFFQVALWVSLLQLLYKGPELNWEKISDTRNSHPSDTKNS